MIGQKTKRDVGLATVLLLLVAACAGVLADDVTHQVREPGAHCCFFFFPALAAGNNLRVYVRAPSI